MTNKTKTILHWFRRDLRVTDNTALSAAVRDSAGQVLPVFVLDKQLLKGKDVAPARVQFMLESLQVLDKQLHQRGSHLILLHGDPRQELPKLAQAHNVDSIYFNRDYTPAALARDEAVTQALKQHDIEVQSFKDLVLHEMDELLTGAGKPYTVFTPYKKSWLAAPKQRMEDKADWTLKGKGGHAPEWPTLGELGFAHEQDLPKGGESAAQKNLNEFVSSDRLNRYNVDRDFPAINGTSHLSPHLRMGTISPRQCYYAALEMGQETASPRRRLSPQSSDPKKTGSDAWISELIWRDFYMQVLYHFPHANHTNFNKAYDALRWGNGDRARDKDYFAAWCEGRTGYPIIDAAMRQLNQTGWMHNRLRMIVASFLTKDLLIDWRKGESYFMLKLVDGDPASNNGGWQWAASTGTDAQPYFRIFNPMLQSKRFDENGDFIRTWVPELKDVPTDYIHEPSTMPDLLQQQSKCVIGRDYPAPIVDHATQKDEILERFKAVR